MMLHSIILRISSLVVFLVDFYNIIATVANPRYGRGKFTGYVRGGRLVDYESI